MSEDLHPMDDLFRTGLNDREESPTPAVWDAIEKELDKKDRKPAGGFFRLSGRAAVIALVLLGSVGLFAAGYYLRGMQVAREQKKNSPATEIPARSSAGQESQQALQNADFSKNEQTGIPQNNGTGHSQKNEADSVDNDITDALIPEPESRNIQQPSAIDVPKSAKPKEAYQVKEDKKFSGQNNPTVHKSVSERQASYQPSAARDKGRATSAQVPVALEEEAAAVKEMALPESPVASHMLIIPAQKIPATVKPLQPPGMAQTGTVAEKNAQQIPVANKKATGLLVPKFSLTPYAAYQSHSVKLDDDGSSWGYNMREDMERTEQLPAKISGGILADMRIGKQFSLQTGLGLMQLDVNIQPKRIKAEKDIDGKVKYRLDCSAGTYFINPKQGNYPRPGDTISTQMATNALKYLTIPLAVKYHFGTNKLQFFATAGTGINLLTSQNLNAMVNHQYQYYGGRTTNLKSSYFNGMIGAGATYFINKRIGIYVSPQYNFALTSMNEGLPVKSMPRTFNVQAGITIKL